MTQELILSLYFFCDEDPDFTTFHFVFFFLYSSMLFRHRNKNKPNPAVRRGK